MSRGSLKASIAICLIVGLADLGVLNLWLAPAAWPPASEGGRPGAPGEPPSAEPVKEPAPAEPVKEPAPAEPVKEPAPAEPVKEPAPAEPVKEPAPAEPVKEPAPAVPSPAPPALPRTSTVQFDTSLYNLTPVARRELNQLITGLKRNRALKVRIEGHADRRGEVDFNDRLSWHRARAVASHLKARGIAAGRIILKGHGSSQPLDRAGTPAALARNRRAVIRIIKGNP